jgi:hypothetical protein
MQSDLYPLGWKQRARECLERAGYRCEQCGIPHGTMRVGKHRHNLYFIYLHAAHINHDIENPQAELRALCPACHMRHDWQSQRHVRNKRRSGRPGYQVISAACLVAELRAAGLYISQEGDHYRWQTAGISGCASSVLDALGCALHCLVMEVTL